MVPPLETPRLLLRPLKLGDATQTQSLFPHWEIVRFLAKSIPWPYPQDGALQYYRNLALPAMERGDEWHWSLRLKTRPRQLIGCVALLRAEHNNRGFWLGLPWQGQGLMTEAAEAITSFWFNDLGFPEMRVSKAAMNRASRRISEKNGMRLIGIEEKEYVGGRFTTEVWSITAEEWRFRHPKPH